LLTFKEFGVRQVAGANPGGNAPSGGKKGKKSKKGGNNYSQDHNGQQLNKMVKRAKKKNCKC
jgi:hypothetical protein